MGKRNWIESHQRIMLCLCIALGVILSDGILLAPIHEHGHKHWAEIEEVSATITDWNHTAIGRVTPGILMAGYESEIVGFLIVYAILFFISSPQSINIRRYWFHLGFPLAYASWSWLKPLLFPVTDFVMVPAWTAGMRGTLFTEYVVFMAIAWVMLLVARVRVVDK